MEKDKPYILTVLLITYNHEKYVAQAIEGVINQNTKYPYKINVIDDCSTDNTINVVKSYQKRYPGIINIFINTQNSGADHTQKNTYRGYKTVDTKYFTLLEGDDYWNDLNKIQQQLDLLEENPKAYGCAHRTIKFFEGKKELPQEFGHKISHYESVYTSSDFIKSRVIFHLSSLIFRNPFKNQDIPLLFRSKYMCDLLICAYIAQYGPILFLDEYMSCYRIHNSGVFSVKRHALILKLHIIGSLVSLKYFKSKYFWDFNECIGGFARVGLSEMDKNKASETMLFLVAYLIHLIIKAIRRPSHALRYIKRKIVRKLVRNQH